MHALNCCLPTLNDQTSLIIIELESSYLQNYHHIPEKTCTISNIEIHTLTIDMNDFFCIRTSRVYRKHTPINAVKRSILSWRDNKNEFLHMSDKKKKKKKKKKNEWDVTDISPLKIANVLVSVRSNFYTFLLTHFIYSVVVYHQQHQNCLIFTWYRLYYRSPINGVYSNPVCHETCR